MRSLGSSSAAGLPVVGFIFLLGALTETEAVSMDAGLVESLVMAGSMGRSSIVFAC